MGNVVQSLSVCNLHSLQPSQQKKGRCTSVHLVHITDRYIVTQDPCKKLD